ncbi:MAG TPA: amidohydrolase family protein [Candidatus Nanoarchaeia archaeon]|nr:amidohydrolase family protein [Candidatus Nanoarchaeia archaeon]
MKKMLASLASLITLSLFIFSCSPQIPEVVEEAPQQIEDMVQPEVTAETVPIPATETPKEEVKEETKPAEYSIIQPKLKYEGAYNGPLYGTSEQVGSASMNTYFELLDKNGINFFIGMFGIEGEPSTETLTSDTGLGEVIDAAQKHPHRVIPFFNPGIGGEEVEKYLGDELTGMYAKTLAASKRIVGNDFIRGFGEVETQEWAARHNDARVLQLINLAQKNDINFMFHPVASKIDDVEKIIEAYPDTAFLIHMYREDLDDSKTQLIKLLQEHDNLYFSMDAAHILFVNGNDIIYTYDSTNKKSSIDEFVSTYESKEKQTIDNAIRAYKPLVDAVPDKVMWGTEIGPEYAFDPQVFDRAVKISRFVIAGFNSEHQEAVGYKNALRVFGQGVVADANIKVLNTGSWPDCTTAQMNGCDDSCGNPDTDGLTAEQEACYKSCLNKIQCKEVVEMDVG